MPKCAMYLFRVKSVCFACEERVIFFVNDVAVQPSRLQLQHLVLYWSFGSQLACAIWESNTHLFVRTKSVLHVGSQFTHAVNRGTLKASHGYPGHSSFDT